MSNAPFNWSAVQGALRDLGGWEATSEKPGGEPDGADFIANRPDCWSSKPVIPEWWKEAPDPAEETDAPEHGFSYGRY